MMTSRPRGHWPAGKRRHPTRGVGPVLARLRRLLDRHHRRGWISLTVAARGAGVDRRSLSRWLAGELVPSPEHLAALAAWLDEATERLRTGPPTVEARCRRCGRPFVRDPISRQIYCSPRCRRAGP